MKARLAAMEADAAKLRGEEVSNRSSFFSCVVHPSSSSSSTSSCCFLSLTSLILCLSLFSLSL